MCRYLNEPEMVSRIDDVANAIRRELRLWERISPPANGIVAHWDENYPDCFRQVSLFSRNWVTDRLNEIRTAFQPANAPARFSVLAEVQRLLDQVTDMQDAFES